MKDEIDLVQVSQYLTPQTLQAIAQDLHDEMNWRGLDAESEKARLHIHTLYKNLTGDNLALVYNTQL